MCNKITYETRQQALEDAREIRVQKRYFRMMGKEPNEDKGKKLKPYQCPACNYWHLTSKKNVKKLQKSRRRQCS